MAIIKRPINDLFNLIQVSSLELSKQLLTKKYYNSRLYLANDEYNTEDVDDPNYKLLWRRGDYQVGFNGDWNSVSDPRNLDPAAQALDWISEIHTQAPYYDPADPNYDATKDMSTIAYVAGSNERYAFISLRGTMIPNLGVTWIRESVSGAVDGDNINFNLAVRWVGRKEYPAYVPFSDPTNEAYDPSNETGNYDSAKDPSNVSGGTRADGSLPVTPYYDPAQDVEDDGSGQPGTSYNPQYVKDENNFDRTVVTKLPICSDEDNGKAIIGFTNNSLSTPIALQLTDNAERYEVGDIIYLKTGETTIGDGNKGVDWKPVEEAGAFDVKYKLKAADIESLKGLDEATMSVVVLPDESFAVDSLIFTVDYTRK